MCWQSLGNPGKWRCRWPLAATDLEWPGPADVEQLLSAPECTVPSHLSLCRRWRYCILLGIPGPRTCAWAQPSPGFPGPVNVRACVCLSPGTYWLLSNDAACSIDFLHQILLWIACELIVSISVCYQMHVLQCSKVSILGNRNTSYLVAWLPT